MRLRSLCCFLCLLFLTLILASHSAAQNLKSRYLQPAQVTPNIITPAPTTLSTGVRTIRMVNNCSYVILVGHNGSDSSTPPGGCARDADCGVGRGCNTTNHVCFYDLQSPTKGQWVLFPKGMPFNTATWSLQPATKAPLNVRWNGTIFPRTDCSVNTTTRIATCSTGSCGKYICDPGVGPRAPFTAIEMYIDDNGYDTYDIQQIEGSTVPVEVKPEPGGDYKAASGENWKYWCSNAGGNPNSQGLPGCTWNFTPGSGSYRIVTNGGKTCGQDSECGSTQKCGLSPAAVEPNGSGKKTCGNPLGYWTPHAICERNSKFVDGVMDCTQSVDSEYGKYGTMTNMYGCVVVTSTNPYRTGAADSCYNVNSPTCCGCVSNTDAHPDCLNYNKCWQDNVLPKIQFLKDACPTTYTYQYDDKTSTFTCQTNGASNTANYVITFCPNNVTGRN